MTHLILLGRAVCGCGATTGVSPASLERVTCGRCRDVVRASADEVRRRLGPGALESSKVEYHDFASGEDVIWVHGPRCWLMAELRDGLWRVTEHDEWGAFRGVAYDQGQHDAAARKRGN